MSPQRRNQLAAVGGLALAGGLLAIIAFGGIEDNLVYFWDVDELVKRGEPAYGKPVRLGGVVQNGSHKYDPQNLSLKFNIAMLPEGTPGVLVEAHGAPPQMFREGIGVVVEGTYDGSRFSADRVIVKHSNEYKPPEPGQEADKVYKTLVDS